MLGEDLAQATLERLWPRWHRVAARGDAWAYTSRIAVSINASWRRRRWWHAETSQDVEAEPHGVYEENVPTRVDVERWLARLGERQRTVIVLRYLMDLSVGETARVMDCSEGTVKSQTARALVRLREVSDIGY